MSHIRQETIEGYDTVHPAVLTEGLKVAAQILEFGGVQVTDHIYDWYGERIMKYSGMQILIGLDAKGATSSGSFPGMGLALNAQGKLAIVGDFYYAEQKQQAEALRKKLDQILGSACYFAARAMIAKAKGQNTAITIDQETHQLQLTVTLGG